VPSSSLKYTGFLFRAKGKGDISLKKNLGFSSAFAYTASMTPLTVLLIDDAPDQIALLNKYLKQFEPFPLQVSSTMDPQEGIRLLEKSSYDMVLTDYRMPGLNGLDILNKAKELNPLTMVLIITSQTEVNIAVECMKAGAYDLIQKPVHFESFQKLITNVAESVVVQKENRIVRQHVNLSYKEGLLLSGSQEMEKVFNMASRAAIGPSTILIRGESGTGKELIAKTIHSASERKDKPFVVVNLASLPESLIESELFGHKKGAFTGAGSDRIGRFEQAHGGTLFLDEAGDIPMGIQVKLLRVLQFGTFEPLGSNDVRKADVRIIAATNRNLEKMIKDGDFRQDLYYRLNVISLWLPPLRKRKEDIPLLASHFITRFAAKWDQTGKRISNKAMDKLMRHPFPGNIRELENIIERAMVLCRGDIITDEDVSLTEYDNPGQEFSSEGNGRKEPLGALLDPENLQDRYEDKIKAFERVLLSRALEKFQGNQRAAARHLGITERRLRSRLERLDMENPFLH